MKKKNYYELSSDDMDMYKNYYSQIRYARFLNECKIACLIMFIVGFVVGNVLSLFAEYGFEVLNMADMMKNIALISFVIYFPLIIYDNLCFKRWLKIKHNIEY